MQIKVNGQQIEVSVSDGGMFYDEATKTISASTLKGLKKKLVTALIPKSGIPVENTSGRKGVVTSRVSGKGYRRHNYYNVKWEDDSFSEEYGPYLYRRITEEERIKKEQIQQRINSAKKEVETAQAPLTKAQTELYTFTQSLSVIGTLTNAFPSN